MQKRIWIAFGVAVMLAGPAVADGKVSSSADLSGWMGFWFGGADKQISIAPGIEGGLSLDAFAQAENTDPFRTEAGAVNTGGIAGQVPADWIRGNTLTIASTGLDIIPTSEAGQYDCWVNLTLEGEALIVDDNGRCGAINAELTGTYTRDQ